MPVRTAEAQWNGDLPSGSGTLKTETGSVDGQYSFASRFENGTGTNPEELIAAAHAGCFSMALSNILAEAGHDPEQVRTTAKVRLDMSGDGPSIDRIDLICRARVPGIDQDHFVGHAEEAKKGCPVSKALAAVEITLDAKLEE
jgi:osmotically inducible protein OsmC